MYRFLLSDADFRELNIPIPPQDYRALEIQVSKYQPLKPVPTWNGYILTGYEQDHLCQKYHRSYPTTEMKFQRKADAMAWICRKQLEREDINWAARAWLLYRLYEALREIDKRREAKEDFQYRKISPGAHTAPQPRRETENIAVMQHVAEEYDYNKGTMYHPFFLALYFEFRAQTKGNGNEKVNAYKAESINQVLRPLKEMMKNEVYGDMLQLINGEEEEEMTYTDVMILLTQYKSALAKYNRKRLI